jgi:hypothetical protein
MTSLNHYNYQKSLVKILITTLQKSINIKRRYNLVQHIFVPSKTCMDCINKRMFNLKNDAAYEYKHGEVKWI